MYEETVAYILAKRSYEGQSCLHKNEAVNDE